MGAANAAAGALGGAATAAAGAVRHLFTASSTAASEPETAPVAVAASASPTAEPPKATPAKEPAVEALTSPLGKHVATSGNIQMFKKGRNNRIALDGKMVTGLDELKRLLPVASSHEASEGREKISTFIRYKIKELEKKHN